jgi:hypothetical protein
VTTFKGTRNEAVVEDLDFVVRGAGVGAEIGLGIATAYGLPYIAGIVPEGPAVGAELVDGEYDPVRCLKAREVSNAGAVGRILEVWSAADDAIVRRYYIYWQPRLRTTSDKAVTFRRQRIRHHKKHINSPFSIHDSYHLNLLHALVTTMSVHTHPK